MSKFKSVLRVVSDICRVFVYLLVAVIPACVPDLMLDAGIPEAYWRMGMIVTCLPCCVAIFVLHDFYKEICNG